MLNDILLGQYFPGDSLVHRLDPRTKIIVVMLFISSIFLAETFLAYGILTLFTCVVIGIAGIPAGMVLRSIKPLWIIVLLTLGIHVFTTPGNVV